MNADRPDTRDLHLDLEDLTAAAAGQPVGDRAQDHIAGCRQCQREAKRWTLVADGIRGMAAAAPETARPVRPRRVWRRGMLAAGGVAAAVVLLLGIGAAAGLVHVSLSGSGSGSGTALTAVTGCSRLEQADGTLERVNGSSLVIKTASGQPVTVTTTASTFMSMSGPLLSDITDGASVMVRGIRSGGRIQAAIVTVGQPFSAVNPAGFIPVQGTVRAAGNAGFTLVTSAGTRIPVATSASTLVVIPHVSPGQLRAGGTVFALGRTGPDGTLSARGVAAITQVSPGGHLGVSMRVRNCSPGSIIEALGAISAG